jgi:type II secretory pathway pseudopilin PulG
MPSDFKRGFTFVELVIIIIIIAIGLGLLVPYLQASREKARLQTCINNMKQIGLAMHEYHDLNKRLPGSADLLGSGPIKQAGGYSFLVHILPMMDQDKLYKTLPIVTVVDPLASNDPNVVAARNTLLGGLICPSNPNKRYQDPWKRLNAFTNYKGMGATTAESLICCADPMAPLPYGNPMSLPETGILKINHPDGALFPGKGLRFADFIDGTAGTFMAVETMDDSNSVWIAGSDATLVGMPKTAMLPASTTTNPYWYPTGFNRKYNEEASPEIQALRTYLAFDFSLGGKDAGKYPPSVGRTPNYGPSSAHPNVVNHLFVDGAVRCIRKDADYAMYFFSVTPNNGDPGGGCDCD